MPPTGHKLWTASIKIESGAWSKKPMAYFASIDGVYFKVFARAVKGSDYKEIKARWKELNEVVREIGSGSSEAYTRTWIETRGGRVTVIDVDDSTPLCYAICGGAARRGRRFCSDKCAAIWAEQSVEGNDEVWCPICLGWRGPYTHNKKKHEAAGSPVPDENRPRDHGPRQGAE